MKFSDYIIYVDESGDHSLESIDPDYPIFRPLFLHLHQRITAGQHQLQASDGSDAMPQFEIVFASKMTNSSGLQIADLIARPTGLSVLRPEQVNRAFEVIKEKIWTGPTGAQKGASPYGLKIFP